MNINVNKSIIVHFRKPFVEKITLSFMCGDQRLSKVDRHIFFYLGLVLNDILDYSIAANAVVQNANRALSLLTGRRFPHDIFKNL